MEGGNFPSRLQSSTNGGSTDKTKKNGTTDDVPVEVRGQDQYLPSANIVRIMRKVLPPNAKISDDTKETIQECVSEFISFITSEANERCQREHRKTVTAEDLIWAMGKLGFDDYIEPLTAFVNRYRRMETGRSPIQTEYAHHGYVDDPIPLGVPLNYGPQAQMFDANGPLNGPGQAYYYEDSSGSGSGSGVGGYCSTSGIFDLDQFGQFK